MKLSKNTITKVREEGKANIYSAKKVANRYGNFIIVTYAALYLQDGKCTAISTTRTTEIEGSTQQDIINYFCNL